MTPALPSGVDADRSFGWVVVVAAAVIAVSLAGAWQATRNPVPAMSDAERQALYQSNLTNFAQSCERPGGIHANPGLFEFCRKQASLLELLSECDDACRRRTAAFTSAEPSK